MSTKAKVILLSIVILVLILIVVLIPFLFGEPNLSGDINYEDFQKAKDGENSFIYYGTVKEKEKIDTFKERYETSIGVLSPSSLKDSEKKNIDLKENHLYIFNKGKQVYDEEFDFSYKGIKELIEKHLITGNFIEVNIDEYKDIIKSEGTNYMFVGRETCSWCTKFKQEIKNALKDNTFIIYYIDTDKLGNSLDPLYETDDYFTKEDWGTPLTLIYKDGKRIDVINGYVESSELVSNLKKNKVL